MHPQLLKYLVLSEEQLPALDLKLRNLFVSAGAGSGKTRVLIARFAHLVLEGEAQIAEIAAITFTERAASEMKRRLVELFEKIGREDLKREVEEAYVSTFHSFASRILKEYALEAGIDPEFQVLTEDEKAAIESELWESLLAEPELEAIIYPLLLSVGSPEKLKEEMLSLRCRLLSSAIPEPWNALEPALPPSSLLEPLQAAIRTMERVGKLSKSEDRVLDAFRLALGELQAKEPREPLLIQEAASFTLSGKRPEWHEMLQAIKGLTKEYFLSLEDQQGAPRRVRMKELLKVFEERIAWKKRETGCLDFDDLLNRLLDFLRRDDFVAQETRKALQRKFKFILMDELQDSNPVESEILGRLSTGKNLFLVGDAKQSIYAFRQAEVGIFLGLEERAKAEGGFLNLRDNYRSRPEILDFVNGLFSEEVFRGSRIVYEPLVAKKAARGRTSVECLIVNDPPDAEGPVSKDLRQIREAEAIAGRLLALITSPAFPGLRYGDMALLLKNFTDVSVYERAFRVFGIPYTVIAGRGFYQKSEVLDLVSFLKVVENPLDDIALAAVFRSPLVDLSDVSLWLLAEERRSVSKEKGTPVYLWNCLHRETYWKKLPPKDRKALNDFLVLQRRLAKQKSQLAIGGVLREIIVSTQYDTKVLLETDGKRKFSNLEKLSELARPFDKRNLNLAAFLKNLEQMTVKEVRESEAQLDTQNEDTVKILTVHKAKGLEFRVVAVADFDTGSRSDQSLFNFSKEWGLGARLDADKLGKVTSDYRFLKNKEREKRSREEEARRILYVACTRAQDHLILSTAPAAKGAKTFLSQLLSYLGAQEGEAGLFKGVEVRQILSGNEKGSARISLLNDPGFQKAFLAGKKVPERPERTALRKKWTSFYEKVSKMDFPTYQGLTASVTSLLEYQDCPKQYYFRRTLGFPGSFSSPPEKPSEEERGEDEMTPADYGTYFHSLLEKWDYSGNLLEAYDKEKGRIVSQIPEGSRKRLEKELYLFALSPLAGELKNASQIERELSFEWLPRELFRVRGQIDLLYLAESGEWNLVDYKTSRISSLREAEEKKEYYQLQLSAYGALLMRVLSLPSLKCSLYFSALGESLSWVLDRKEAGKCETGLVRTLERIAGGEYPLNRGEACLVCPFQKPCFKNFMIESTRETAGSL